jgi:hypothetical protein
MARYQKEIPFDAVPVSAITMVASGSRGLAGGEAKPASGAKPTGEKPAAENTEAKKEEKPKSGGGILGVLRPSSQKQQSGVVASAGGRAIDKPDRDAVGGPNKTRIPVKLSPTEIAEFKKGIA